MNIDLVLKRLELIKEGKGIGTISDVEASIILNKIERLNNIINEKNEEIEDYSNKWCELAKAKTKSDNIINKLERYINEEYIYDELGMKIFDASTLQDKLQELKGSDKE